MKLLEIKRRNGLGFTTCETRRYRSDPCERATQI